MSTNLSLSTVIEANKLSSGVPFIVLVEVELRDPDTGTLGEVIHVARNPEPVVFEGNTYEPAVFDINLTGEQGAPMTASLSIRDYLQSIQAHMEAMNGCIGSRVTLTIVNADNLAQGAEIREVFEVTAATSSEFGHDFTLGAENTLMLAFPRRRQTRDYCQWRFKSRECGYTGPSTYCDLTLQGPNGCAAKENTINFGAYPALNSNGVRYR